MVGQLDAVMLRLLIDYLHGLTCGDFFAKPVLGLKRCAIDACFQLRGDLCFAGGVGLEGAFGHDRA